MIVDTSVIIAFLREEPETPRLLDAMLAEKQRLKMSVANYLEAGIVIDAKADEVLSERLQQLIDFFDLELVPVDRTQADVARRAYFQFGKGRHPAKLNFGDCFAYALARVTAEPLLFKGDDFVHTDIIPASLP